MHYSKYILFILFNLLIFQSSFSEDVEDIDFQFFKDNMHVDNKPVRIKGFLYHSLDKKWMLSQDPNLKSCCVGKKELEDRQILLIGDFSEDLINQVVMVSGMLYVSNEGKRIDQSKLIITRNKPYFTYFLIGGAILLIIFFLKKLVQ